MPKILATMLLVFFPASHCCSQGSQHNLRASFNDSLGTLATAKDLKQLARVWAVAPKDYPHRAVHAAMYAKFEGPDADSILIGAMPGNGRQMEALYGAQDTRQGQDMAVTGAYLTFYTQLANALTRHPQKLPQFLRMIHAFHYVDNVDEWPFLCGLASKTYAVQPDAYVRAVHHVEPEFRRDAMDCRQPPDAP